MPLGVALPLILALVVAATVAPLRAEQPSVPDGKTGQLTGRVDGQRVHGQFHTRSFGTHEITTFRGQAGQESIHGRVIRFPTAREGTSGLTVQGRTGSQRFHATGTERWDLPGRAHTTLTGVPPARIHAHREHTSVPGAERLTARSRVDDRGVTFNGFIQHLDGRPGMTGYWDPRERLGSLRPSAAARHLGPRHFEGRDDAASHLRSRPVTITPAQPDAQRPRVLTTTPERTRTVRPRETRSTTIIRTPESAPRAGVEVHRQTVRPERTTSIITPRTTLPRPGESGRSSGASSGSSPFPER